jgi:hypothetical protein
MAISNAYPTGIPVADADLFVGTKAYTNRTVNYTAQGIADYLNINAKVSIGGQMSFRFSITPDISKTISFEGGLGNNTPFADITRLVTSGSDASGSDITIFLNYLIDTQILLAEQNQPNNFGHYKITGYSQIGITDFYNLDLEYIGGNGNIVDDIYYDLVSFNLSGGVGSTPTLQEVTDVGNTATNTIEHNNGSNLKLTLSNDGTIALLSFYDSTYFPSAAQGVYTGYGFELGDEFGQPAGISASAQYDSGFIGFKFSRGLSQAVVSLQPNYGDFIGDSIGLYFPKGYPILGNPVIPISVNGNFADDYGEITISAGATDLAYTPSPTNGIVTSSTGTDATLPLADVTNAGLLQPADFTQLSTLATDLASKEPTITAGTTSQYWRGDKTWQTLPSNSSGGSSVAYYLNGGTAASVATYFQMSKTAVLGTGVDFLKAGNGLISQWLTDVADPNRLEIPAGNWNFEMYMSASSAGGTPAFYVELLKYDGATFTTIANNSAVPEAITNGTTIDLYVTALSIPQTTLLVTDRLAIRVYIVNSTGGRTITMHTQDSHLCEIITNFAGGISALNGLVANTQNFAVGTSGTDFAISSVSDTHTFNIPTASASNRGLLSSANWSTFNNKSNDILFQDITINMPTNGSVNVNNVVGTALTIGGTPGIRTITDTNVFTRTTRVAIETTIVPANVFTFRQVVGYFSINTGFKASFKFGGSTGATNTNVRYSIGVFVANFIVTNVDPTTFINCMAFARIDGNNNWQFIHNDNTGPATAIDLGASFPANVVSTDMYYATIETISGNIKYTLTRLNTGDTVTGTVSSNIVAASTLLGLSGGCSNNANAAICALDFGGMQLIKFT